MGRSLKSRFMEHRRLSSGNSEVSKHLNCDQSDHSISLDSVRILEVEQKWFEKGVREAIQIWINNLVCNKATGRYNVRVLGREGEEGGGTWSQDLQARILDLQHMRHH